MTRTVPRHVPVAVIGGGQAGLSMSWHLKQAGIDHVVFEKHRAGHAWRDQRWDSFCLVTPNWQCLLPGHPYAGDDPHGFMLKDEIVAYVEDYVRAFSPPLREGLGVDRLSRLGGRFLLETAEGATTADAVVLAVGGYHTPFVPRIAERLPEGVAQIHSAAYRNPEQLPEGAVMVVGSGQSGCQIAEDLHLAGRRVHLVVGSAPRCPRVYRGRDAVDWLADLGQYDLPVNEHPLKEKVRRKANHYLTGRDGGRDIDLRRFAAEGMRLHGRLDDVAGGRMRFRDDLAQNLDAADTVYNGICALIDRHVEDNAIAAPPPSRYEPVWRPDGFQESLDPVAEGIAAIVWCTGFRPNWSWVDLPIFDGNGYPTHERGVTAMPGVYTLGLPWLWTWGSGRFVGVGRDADYLRARIAEHLSAAELRATG